MFVRPRTTLVGNDAVKGVDAFGFVKIDLEFNAFIPGRIGKHASHFKRSNRELPPNPQMDGKQWFDEPGGSRYITATDHRDFGGGFSRMKSSGSIDSKDIGRLEWTRLDIDTVSGFSERMLKPTSRWFPTQVGKEDPSSSVSVKDVSSCESRITVKGHGTYPLGIWPTWLKPSIDYEVMFILKRCAGKFGTIKIKGSHNLFPNFEAKAGTTWVYSFDTEGVGPGFGNLSRSKSFSTQENVYWFEANK